MRREGVVLSIEAQDGHCGPGEFFVGTGVTVIIDTGFVTKLQGREAFVKLADCPRLEEQRGMEVSNDRAEAERMRNPAEGSVPSRRSRCLLLSPGPLCVCNSFSLKLSLTGAQAKAGIPQIWNVLT